MVVEKISLVDLQGIARRRDNGTTLVELAREWGIAVETLRWRLSQARLLPAKRAERSVASGRAQSALLQTNPTEAGGLKEKVLPSPSDQSRSAWGLRLQRSKDSKNE